MPEISIAHQTERWVIRFRGNANAQQDSTTMFIQNINRGLFLSQLVSGPKSQRRIDGIVRRWGII